MRSILIAAAILAFGIMPIRAAEPTVEVKIKAIKDLLPLAEYLGDLGGVAEQADQGAKFIEAMAGKKGIIEGIDINKPIGFYASMTPAVVDSPMVVLIPIGDEKAFMNLLTGKLNINPEKEDDDVYSVTVPGVPPKVYFRFHKGYACATVLNKATLDAKNLIDPKDFFAKPETAIASVVVHVDRVPAEVRKTLLGQIELKLADEKAKAAKDPLEGKIRDFTIDGSLSSLAMLLNEGKTASLKLNIDPKTDDIGLEFALSGQTGSDLNSLLAAASRKKAIAPQAATRDAIVSASVNLQVPESFKKKYGELVDQIIAAGLDNAKGNDRDIAKKVLDAIEPSLKAGILEFGISLMPSSNGKHEILSALRVASGKGIESLAKELAPFIPADQVKIKFDVEKLGSATLHEIVPPANDETEKIFGSSSLWLTTADDLLVLGFAPNSASAKKLAAAEPQNTPIFSFETSVTRLIPIVEPQTSPETIKVLIQEVYADGKPATKDTIKLTVNGGEQLSVGVSIKGRAAKFLALLQKKKQE